LADFAKGSSQSDELGGTNSGATEDARLGPKLRVIPRPIRRAGHDIITCYMQSKATTVDRYLADLPDDRREAITKIRAVIRKNLPKGFEETIQYGMIGYVVPHKLYPPGYHCDPTQPLPFACLASQKNHMALYLMSIYGHPGLREWFEEAYKASGKKMDIGKSCVRFKKLDDLPLDVIGEAFKKLSVKQYIEMIESRRPAAAKKSAKKTAKRTA